MVSLGKTMLSAVAIALIVFSAGVGFGVYMQDQRLEDVKGDYVDLSIGWDDLTANSDFVQIIDTDSDFCEFVAHENMDFADEVYEKGLQIENLKSRNEFKDVTRTRKREHNLLRFQVWLNSLKIGQSCDTDYVNVIYFYEDEAEGATKYVQNKISLILADLKREYSDEILLIPVATNMQLDSVKTAVRKYNIDEVPAVLIGENYVDDGLSYGRLFEAVEYYLKQ